jgi:hypothetical protein
VGHRASYRRGCAAAAPHRDVEPGLPAALDRQAGEEPVLTGLLQLLPSSSEPAATVSLKTTNSSKAAATAHLEADRATADRLVAL